MTSQTKATAPAKINLTLHVTGQREDGYHLLDSLVVFADIADHLSMVPAPEMGMSVSGPFADGVPADATNLVWRAAALCGGSFDLSLIKNIPHGAGLGGGSSDAAAVLRTLGQPHLAPKLGADVPVCLSSHPQRMRGIGDQLVAVSGVPEFALVLVSPGVHVATPAVFKALAHKSNDPMAEIPATITVQWLNEQRNDLQTAALCIATEIKDALEALNDADLARMSGSGSTCFGIYPDMTLATDAAKRIAADHPDWWVMPTRTIGSAVS